MVTFCYCEHLVTIWTNLLRLCCVHTQKRHTHTRTVSIWGDNPNGTSGRAKSQMGLLLLISSLHTHTHAHTANTTNNACNCFVFTWSAVHCLPSSPNFPLISLHLWLWITDWEDYYEWMLGGYGMAMVCVNACVMSLQRQPCSIRGVWFISRKRQVSDSPGISRHVDPLNTHRHTHKGKKEARNDSRRWRMCLPVRNMNKERMRSRKQEAWREEMWGRRKQEEGRDTNNVGRAESLFLLLSTCGMTCCITPLVQKQKRHSL